MSYRITKLINGNLTEPYKGISDHDNALDILICLANHFRDTGEKVYLNSHILKVNGGNIIYRIKS